MKRLSFAFTFILLLLALSACTSNPPTPGITIAVATSASTPSQPDVDSYPAPAHDNANAYPAPDSSSQQEQQGSDPAHLSTTPNPNLATVQGTILYDGKPVQGAILYLSDVIYSDSEDQWVSFDRKSSIRTVTNQQGDFIFYNVPPSEYGLVLDTVTSSFLLSVPDGDEIILNLSPGDVLELGKLNYDDLPVPKP